MRGKGTLISDLTNFPMLLKKILDLVMLPDVCKDKEVIGIKQETRNLSIKVSKGPNAIVSVR